MGKGGKGGGRMTPRAASRIQSASARAGGGKVSKGSFASRAQSAAARNSGKQGQRQGGVNRKVPGLVGPGI